MTVEPFVASAVTEKAAARIMDEVPNERAARGSRERYEAALATVPGMEPEAHDRL